MKKISFSLIVAMILAGQGSSAASPLQLSQIDIPVPTVDEAPTAPSPAEPPALEPAPGVEPAPAPEPPPSLDAAPPPEAPPDPSIGPSVSPEATPPTTSTPANSTGASSGLYFLSRAKNLARQAGIEENGGLAQYRPEASMYGPALQSPFRNSEDGSVTFIFLGGAPGAPAPSIETEVLVDSNAAVSVVYNGTPRGERQITSKDAAALKALDDDSFIARARNLARQAGIAENGGLRVYRPEPSMFGPTSGAPVVTNDDGSVTFTFKGGAPQSPTPTQETAVTVTREGTVTVDFNRPLN